MANDNNTMSSRAASCRSAAVLLAAALYGPTALAADAAHGASLYQNGPSGGPGCASCHGPSPSDNAFGILKAANTPSVIANAIAANKGGMGMFSGRLSAADLDDLAAYIADPSAANAPNAALSPLNLTFPSTTVGSTAGPLTAVLSNTGNATLTLSSLSLSGAAAGDYAISGGSCSAGASVAAGASCDVALSFSPAAAGERSASLVIAHDAASGSNTLNLSGTGASVAMPTVSLSATSLDLGAAVVGTPSTQKTLTVQNTGQAALNFSSIATAGEAAADFALAGTCSTAAPVAANESCTVLVTLTPSAAGARNATLDLVSDASNGTQSVSLTGSGSNAAAPAASTFPTALAFGAAVTGGSLTRTLAVTNTGNTALSLDGTTFSGSTAFSAGSGGTCGSTLPAGASCRIAVSFAPTAQGEHSATLSILMAGASPLTVALTGTGSALSVGVPALSQDDAVGFADTSVGTASSTQSVTLSNSGPAAFSVGGVSLEGTHPADFAVSGSCASGATVSPGASCTASVAFQPTAAGARSAVLLVSTDGGSVFPLALAGNGVAVGSAALALDPQTVSFGNVTVGASANKTVTLSNSGSLATTIGAVTANGGFTLGSGTCPAAPFALAVGQSCTLVLQVQPTAAGGLAGTLVVSDQGGTLTIEAALSATAVEAAKKSSNKGGGGCSAAADARDPMLPLLALAAAAVLFLRRRRRALTGTEARPQ